MIGKEKERGDLFMNKNLKRALNTTAAVSMSLAMVLGAVAPVSAARVADSSVTDKVAAKDAYKLVEELYNAIGEDVYEAYKTDTFKDAVLEKFQEIKNIELQNIVKDNGLLVATATDAWTGTTDVAELVKFVADNSSYVDDADEDVVNFAKFLNGLTDGIKDLETTGIQNETTDVKNVFADYANGIDNENYKAASALYKKLTDNADYLNAVVKEENRKVVNERIADFKADVEDYRDENEDSFVKDYVRQLEKLAVDGKEVYDLVEKEADINYSNLKAVERLLKNIKADKAGLTAAKYEDVKDAEEVAAYIEGLEAIVEDMKEVKELLDDNANVESYKKNLAKLVDGLVEELDKDHADQDDKDEAIEKAMTQFRKEDRTALKEFVEGFVEEFYTLTPKQLSSGKYVVRLENAEYGRYVNPKDVFAGDVASLETLLTTVMDSKASADTYYDELVEAVATVDELLKAVTTDIEGLTLDSKITSVEAGKIIKARKALNQLLDANGKIDSEYAGALTRKEEKEILANKELIETLYLKLIINGEVTTIGWVETPQGWEYYDNNGKRVYEGWAPGNGYWSFMKNGYSVSNEWCAAKEGWYYMGADGKMVTGKVMINGVEEDFGTDGIWVRK